MPETGRPPQMSKHAPCQPPLERGVASTDRTSRSLLDEIVRDGARQMLAAALRAEVAAYVDAHADQVDGRGRRLVSRNAHHEPRQVTTAAGAVPVRAPRVDDRRTYEVSGERRRFA